MQLTEINYTFPVGTTIAPSATPAPAPSQFAANSMEPGHTLAEVLLVTPRLSGNTTGEQVTRLIASR